MLFCPIILALNFRSYPPMQHTLDVFFVDSLQPIKHRNRNGFEGAFPEIPLAKDSRQWTVPQKEIIELRYLFKYNLCFLFHLHIISPNYGEVLRDQVYYC